MPMALPRSEPAWWSIGRRTRVRLRWRLRALRTGIVFTRVWEDGEVDRRALAIGPGTRLLIIASAGDRALDAVAWGATSVLAVDTNPAQLRLTALGIAAAAALGSADLLAMFSTGRRPGARQLYRQALRDCLAPIDRDWWDRWIDIFETGLHVHQPLGIAIAGAGVALRLAGGRELRQTVLESTDAAVQARRYEDRLRWRYWNPVTRRAMGTRGLLRWFSPNPRERAGLRAERYQDSLEERISRRVTAGLLREDPSWAPLLTGRPVDPAHETTWLRPEALDRIRSAPERIRPLEGSLVDVVEALPAGSLDAVGLSNVSDWLSLRELERLWAALARVVVPGGRILARSALRDAPLPTGSLARQLVLDTAASAELAAAERTTLFPSVSLLRVASSPVP